MEFEWDPAKESRNLAKHGISSTAAARVLESGGALEAQSDRGDEARWVAVGAHPTTGKVIAVVYTIRGGRYRIISARRARRNKEHEYRTRLGKESPEEEGTEEEDGPGDGG